MVKTVIDLLTNVWYIYSHYKEPDNVVHAYLENVYPKFCGSIKNLSHNGTALENALFAKVASMLDMKQVHSSPYNPRGDGYFENVHNFLKIGIRKHISSELAWDEVTHTECTAFNFVPDEHSKKVYFSCVRRRCIYTTCPITELKIRYMGDQNSLLALVALRNVTYLPFITSNGLEKDKKLKF